MATLDGSGAVCCAAQWKLRLDCGITWIPIVPTGSLISSLVPLRGTAGTGWKISERKEMGPVAQESQRCVV